jgi:signal transduction histidine kinase
VGITAVMIAAYSVGAHARYRLLSLGVLVATATAIVAAYGNNALPPVPAYLGPYLLVVPLWVAGHAIRTRQQRADAFEDRATRLEREQEAATRAAVEAERGRIARELHDVVAHSVSVMLVQAGAARHVLDTAPEQTREALLAVEASGREAMADLRHLLGVLNDDGEGLALAPQPGIEQIESLVRRVGEAGLPVVLRIEGQPGPLPPGINLTAYRIVQEALTNALKYAGLARTEVVLEYHTSELKVEVMDEGTGHYGREDGEQGRGLVGMQERVALYGGSLEAGPRLERGYAVRAWLPLDGSCP